MIALGTIVRDTATGLKGMLTHYQIEMCDQRYYSFQPSGLNNKTGQPAKNYWIVEDRIAGGQHGVEPDLPTQVIGTQATDLASGFSGTIISICLHISGCVHALVMPKGVLKTGEAKDSCDFDLRRLAGPAITKLTEAARRLDEKKRPSPMRVAAYSPRQAATPPPAPRNVTRSECDPRP